MIVKKYDHFLLLTDDSNNPKKFAEYLQGIVLQEYDEQNLVVDLTPYVNFELGQLLYFLGVSNVHRAANHSFVLICTDVPVDDIPFEMVVVPTLQEAKDIIDMEAIERDLGF